MRSYFNERERAAKIYINHLQDGFTVTYLGTANTHHSAPSKFINLKEAQSHVEELANSLQNSSNTEIEVIERKTGTSPPSTYSSDLR